MAQSYPNFAVKTKIRETTYCFKWSFKNVSRIPPIEMNSGDFYPAKDINMFVKCNKVSDWNIYLYKRTSPSDANIKCHLIISDCDDKVLFRQIKTKFFPYNESHLDFTISNRILTADNIEVTLFLNLYILTTKELYSLPTKEEFDIDQQKLFTKDLIKLYDNNVLTDVTLNVNGDIIRVHKTILCARSPVFARMFQQELTEAQSNMVEVKDIEVNILKELIDFMYGKGRCDYDFDTAVNLYYAADKYEMTSLKDICGDIFLTTLTTDKAGQLLSIADNHGDRRLKRIILKFINENIKLCIQKDWWFELNKVKPVLYQEIMDYLSE